MRTPHTTLHENSSSVSTWKTAAIMRRSSEMEDAGSIVHSIHSEGPQQQRRQRPRFGSACQPAPSITTTKRNSMGAFRGGRPNIIRFRASSAESPSNSTIPDLTGSSSSVDDCCSPTSIPRDLVHEKTASIYSIQRGLIKRWTRRLLLIVSQTTKTTFSLALNSLLDVLFWVLSTLFVLIENTAFLIHQNQLLKWAGNSLIRISAFMIHCTRRKRRSQQPSSGNARSADYQRQRHTKPIKPSESVKQNELSPKRTTEPFRRSDPTVKRGLFRRKAETL